MWTKALATVTLMIISLNSFTSRCSDEKFGDILEEIIRSTLTDCTVALIHDYPTEIPSHISTVLTSSPNKQPLYILHEFSVPENGRPPELEDLDISNQTMISYDYTSEALSGQRVLYVIIGKNPVGVVTLLMKAEAELNVRRTFDYFLMWSREGDVKDLLSTYIVGEIKYKLVVEEDLSKLWALCFFCDNGRDDLLLMGEYNETHRLQLSGNPYPELFRGFHGKHLKGMFPAVYNETHLRRLDRNELMEPSPFFMPMLVLLGDVFHYKWKLEESPYGRGDLISAFNDDTDVGAMVKAVMTRKVDFCPFQLLTHSMVRQAHMYPVFYQDYVSFILAKAKPNYTWKILILPFPIHIWFMLSLSASASGLLIGLALLKPKSALSGFNFVVLSLIEQDVGSLASKIDNKIFLGTWWLFAIVMATLYKTQLFYYLTFPPKEKIPDTISELVHSDYAYGGATAQIVLFMILSENQKDDPDVAMIRNNIQGKDSLQDCILATDDPKWACLSSVELLRSLKAVQVNTHGEEMTHLSSEKAFGFEASLAVRRDAVYASAFDKAILSMMGAGVYLRWSKYNVRVNRMIGLRKAKNGETNMHKGDQQGKGPKAHGLDKMNGPFLLVFYGWTLSVIGFLFEMLLNKINRSWPKLRRAFSQKHNRYPFLK